MKFLEQFSIILGISLCAEILSKLIPLSIPASIYGLILMLLALIFKVVKISQIRESASFFMQIMPVIFIPAGAAIIVAGDVLMANFWAIIVIVVISTILVMGASGFVTQIFYNRTLEKERKKLYEDEK